jgi:protein phosphatase
MPLRIDCPHCKGPCLVAEQHVTAPVTCGWCSRPFTAQTPAAAPAAFAAPGRVQRLDIGSATSSGRIRDRNEDSFLVQHLVWSNLDERHEIALLALADGMGGYEAGHRASGMVIRTVGSVLTPLLGAALSGLNTSTALSKSAETIDRALREANAAILGQAKSDPGCKGMGATAEVVLIWDGRAQIGHVGDCRVYHHRDGRLTQVTRDQTLVARMVELGTLTPREALRHPSRNEVSQAVGKQPALEPARYEVQFAPGDWLIAACDGLHAHLDGDALQAELNQPAASAAQRARPLVERTNQLGGSDNCTVLAVHCG